jgi:hypothetical protein
MSLAPDISRPSLERLERAVHARNLDLSFSELREILAAIDRGFGMLHEVDWVPSATAQSDEERAVLFATRFASAFGSILLDPQFAPSSLALEIFAQLSRWTELLFSLSGFGSSDHLISSIMGDPRARASSLSGGEVQRFLCGYTLSSSFSIDLEELRTSNPALAVVFALGWISTRYCFREPAMLLRERLLEWLPGRFGDVRLGTLPIECLSEPYMHCSYAFTPRKHEIKADLIRLAREASLAAGAREWAGGPTSIADEKPTIIVTTEHFSAGHAVYRTHSKCVRALRERFRVVGICYANQQSPETNACFDRVISYPNQAVIAGISELTGAILAERPAMVFHLGVGMSSHVIALASLRLAPVQAVSFGHTATTKSPVVDYMILPEDFVASRDCFTEELILVPPHAMPYEPRRDVDYPSLRLHHASASSKIRVSVPASVMKLNPRFFATLREIQDRASRPVEFHFFPAFARGLVFIELSRRIRNILPDAIVHPELSYEAYCRELALGEFFISPFPYGNMNSIVEAAALGLPGICLDGAEAHAHADAAYFSRLGLPGALIANNIEEYVSAAVRLIDDREWLAHCRRIVESSDLDKAFFHGDPQIFVTTVADLLKRHMSGHSSALHSPASRHQPPELER